MNTTSTNGTYKFCDSDNSFSIALDCVGQSCNAILSYNNLTCSQTGSESWQCSNGVTCTSATGFSSKFSIVQNNEAILQTQSISLNGSSFDFQQDGTGNVNLTLSNGTTINSPSTTVATTATGTYSSSTPSSRKSRATSTRQFFSTSLLVAMLIISLLATQATAITGGQIGAAVDEIFGKIFTLKELGSMSISEFAQDVNMFAKEACNALIGTGAEAIGGVEEVFVKCEQFMLGQEMSVIGSSLGLTLRTFTGLGGILTTALTTAEEATVMTADAGIIPEVFLANSALCALLTKLVVDQGSESLCSSLESALQAHESGSGSSSTVAPAQPSSPAIPSETYSGEIATITGTLLPIPTINPGNSTAAECQLCQLNGYFATFQDFESCSNQSYVSTKDVAAYFCASVVADNEEFSELCTLACQNPCDQWDTNDWLAKYGSFAAGPFPNDYQCAQYCTLTPPPGNESCLGQFGIASTYCVGLCPGPDSCGGDCVT